MLCYCCFVVFRFLVIVLLVWLELLGLFDWLFVFWAWIWFVFLVGCFGIVFVCAICVCYLYLFDCCLCLLLVWLCVWLVGGCCLWLDVFVLILGCCLVIRIWILYSVALNSVAIIFCFEYMLRLCFKLMLNE